jgi:hypothetical protein
MTDAERTRKNSYSDAARTIPGEFSRLTGMARNGRARPCHKASTCIKQGTHDDECVDVTGTVIPRRLPPIDYCDLP